MPPTCIPAKPTTTTIAAKEKEEELQQQQKQLTTMARTFRVRFPDKLQNWRMLENSVESATANQLTASMVWSPPRSNCGTVVTPFVVVGFFGGAKFAHVA